MPGDWKGPFSRRLQRRASERGRRMANLRWELDRERRRKLEALTAEQQPEKIERRIIVIENETVVREAVFWNYDSQRSARAKLRAVLNNQIGT